jgi:hypothetical protein
VSLVHTRRTFSHAVPVSEVFGWRKYGKRVFIYMELMESDTLEKSWETLIEDDRLAIRRRLKRMMKCMMVT